MSLSDVPYFAHTQALFNNPIRGAAAAYPWVLSALRFAALNMPVWTPDIVLFKKILTVIQGIAYLNNLAQIMQIPLDGVRQLHGDVETSWRGKGILGSRPMLDSIFNVMASSIGGSSLVSWISEPISRAEAEQRLNDTNSAIGSNRCLVGDTAAPGIFILIEQVAMDEVLYVLAEREVDHIGLDQAKELRLVLCESFVSTQTGGEFVLSRNPLSTIHVTNWVAHLLLQKFR
ncbi:MAG: hypothetical protein LQ343_001078 [Gyalolechia ehrenbergii]|nr:MAG: hypothetical protein LQ343_001078 [Gyalolechia ehrenbergii]